MIQYILIFLVFSYGGFFSATISKCRFQKGALAGILIAFSTLYGFAIINQLVIGRIIVFCIIIATYCISIHKLVHLGCEERNRICKENLYDFVQFLLLYLILYLMCNRLAILDVDELRVWGAYPKIMFYENVLPQLGDFPFTNYPPALPLIQYLMLSLGSVFSEGVLFVTYNTLQILFIMQIFHMKKKKDAYRLLLESMIILFFPTFFYSYGYYEIAGPYFSLYADIIMGVIFGYGVVHVFYYEETRINTLILYLTVFLLTLLKPASFPLSLVIAGLYGLRNFRKLVDKRGLEFIKDLAKRIMPFFSIALAYMSWFFVQQNRGLESIVAANVQVKPLIDTSLFIRIIKSLCTDPYVSRIFSAVVFLLLFFVITYFLLDRKSKIRTKYIIYFGQISFFFCIYIVFLYLTYLLILTPYEAEILASFIRYVNSYLLGIGVFMLYMVVDSKLFEDAYSDLRRIGMKLLITGFLVISYIFVPYTELRSEIINRSVKKDGKINWSFSQGTTEKALSYVKEISDLIDKDHVWVYFYIEYSPPNIWIRDFTYYKLIDDGIYLNFYPGYLGQFNAAEYLFLASELDEETTALYYEIFQIHVRVETLYRIELNDGEYSLTIVHK